MNPDYFGDSYDIVKRFFCGQLRELGYRVTVDPMFTGDWGGREAAFHRFIGAFPDERAGSKVALFYDPDTGVAGRASARHVSLQAIAEATTRRELVFSFDQSFSRQHDPIRVMQEKLLWLRERDVAGFYYQSHASFLFASRSDHALAELKAALLATGLPPQRLIHAA